MTRLRTIFSLLVVLPAVSAKSYCPPDAFQGLTPNDCYTLGKHARTFDESETVCAINGGHLASITSAFQNALLAKVAALGKTSYYQLGGRLVNGTWTWTDGSSFAYTNWAKGQPDNSSGACLAIHRRGTWIVTDCSQPADYFCRVPPITVPVVNVPTTTPSASICASDQWTYVPETKKCYWAPSSVDTWRGQFSYCMDHNGTLASIHSAEEAIAIEQYVLSDGTYNTKQYGYVVGLHDPLGIGLWQWADGSAFDYENWSEDEPNSNGKCVLAASGTYQEVPVNPAWTAVPCDEIQHNAVCQSDPVNPPR